MATALFQQFFNSNKKKIFGSHSELAQISYHYPIAPPLFLVSFFFFFLFLVFLEIIVFLLNTHEIWNRHSYCVTTFFLFQFIELVLRDNCQGHVNIGPPPEHHECILICYAEIRFFFLGPCVQEACAPV